MLKKFLKLYFILLLFTISLNAQEKITLTTFTNSGMGYIPQAILKELYTRLGYEIEIREFPGRRAIDISNSGLSDGEVFRVPMIRNKYPNLLMIPVPLISIKFAAFVRDEDKDILKFNNFDDFKHYDVSTMRGYIVIENIFREKKKKLNVLNTYKQLLLTLKSKRYDVSIITYFDGLNALKRLKLDGITILKPFVSEMPVYHFVHKKNAHMIPKLTAMLEKMKEEGVFDQIEKDVISNLTQR